MVLATRGRTRAAIVLLVGLLAVLAMDGWRWWRAVRWNEAIAQERAATLPGARDGAGPPELRFAVASELAASGAAEEALNRWRALQSDTALGQAARYNAANTLLREAQRLRGTPQAGQAIALIELAKETYRDILRADPSRWDARYNLERAQRLLPDAEDEEPVGGPPQQGERAATTMRGVSRGLP